MNNSAQKQLIRQKGFVYANMVGRTVALIRPDLDGVVRINPQVIEWLRSFPDIIQVEEGKGWLGYYPGDQVQVLSFVADYRFWGMMATIKKVFKTKKQGLMVMVETNETGDIATVQAVNVTVIERPGAVDLSGMSAEEREALVLRMSRGEVSAPPAMSAPLDFTCECMADEFNQHEGFTIDAEDEWLELNGQREKSRKVTSQYILSKSCPEVPHYHVIESTSRLVLVEAIQQ